MSKYLAAGAALLLCLVIAVGIGITLSGESAPQSQVVKSKSSMF